MTDKLISTQQLIKDLKTLKRITDKDWMTTEEIITVVEWQNAVFEACGHNSWRYVG